jgi:hypothetical protein
MIDEVVTVTVVPNNFITGQNEREETTQNTIVAVTTGPNLKVLRVQAVRATT